MSRDFVWTCDFCKGEFRINSLEVPTEIYQISCQIAKKHKGGHEFEVNMCESCWDQMIDPSPKGIIKRLSRWLRF